MNRERGGLLHGWRRALCEDGLVWCGGKRAVHSIQPRAGTAIPLKSTKLSKEQEIEVDKRVPPPRALELVHKHFCSFLVVDVQRTCLITHVLADSWAPPCWNHKKGVHASLGCNTPALSTSNRGIYAGRKATFILRPVHCLLLIRMTLKGAIIVLMH